MIDPIAQITPNQMLAARLALGWSRERLASRSETTATFVWVYERDGRVMRMMSRERSLDALVAIRVVLEDAGVEFTNGHEPGVKLRKSSG